MFLLIDDTMKIIIDLIRRFYIVKNEIYVVMKTVLKLTYTQAMSLTA